MAGGGGGVPGVAFGSHISPHKMMENLRNTIPSDMRHNEVMKNLSFHKECLKETRSRIRGLETTNGDLIKGLQQTQKILQKTIKSFQENKEIHC